MACWIFGFNSLNSYFYSKKIYLFIWSLNQDKFYTVVTTRFLPCAVYLVHSGPTSKDYNLSITSLLSFWHYLRPVLFSISFTATPTNLLIYTRVHVSVLCSDYYLACTAGFAYTVNFKMVLAKCEKAERQHGRCWARFISKNQIYWIPIFLILNLFRPVTHISLMERWQAAYESASLLSTNCYELIIKLILGHIKLIPAG